MNFESRQQPEKRAHELWRKLTDAAYSVLEDLKGTPIQLTKYGEVTFSKREEKFNGSDCVLLLQKGSPMVLRTETFFKLPEIKSLVIEKIIETNSTDQMLQQEILDYLEQVGVSLS